MNIMLGCLYLPVHASYRLGFGMCARPGYASKGTSSMYAVVNHGGILMATLGELLVIWIIYSSIKIWQNKHALFVYCTQCVCITVSEI